MAVFLDLDNTLVDRDGAFARWADDAVAGWGGDAADVAWLIAADAGGYTPRAGLAQMIIDRWGPATDSDRLVAQMHGGVIEHLTCYPGVLAELDALASAGQSLVIVTNGDSRQQREKLRRTGLQDVASAVAISGELGFKKPDARMFESARSLSNDYGAPWMVGDHVDTDMAGARAMGWATAWVSHERHWPYPWTPTLTAAHTADLLAGLHTHVAVG
ncbi:HAD family hydrolase [Glaciibacter flavus]|uniref:HAD family hydrolase n=1 Tax=Orlajensenia flava TaxID=2565934 RepID=UPI003B0034D4